jgi:DNA topoisomerase I
MRSTGQATAAAVPGLTRSDPRAPGITLERSAASARYFDPSGDQITDPTTLARINALAIPPAWRNVWISDDPLGHIQATGVDSRGRTQYLYHQVWRELRDAQKFEHMLRFAGALPVLRAATMRDLKHRDLDRSRVAAGAVRLIDLGLFRIGGEKYADLDHHYGATTLQKRHVSVSGAAAVFDYVGKEGRQHRISVRDPAILATVRALVRSKNDREELFCWRDSDGWRPMHSHDVSAYIASQAGGHYTAKEFRTWNATVLTAVLLANAGPPASARSATTAINAAVRGVAEWLGDTPAVAKASYIDPRLISRYKSDNGLRTIPAVPARLPTDVEAEAAVAALLAP